MSAGIVPKAFIKGDSMKNAGILEGDQLIVRRQETAENGEIIVALIGEEATVKRYFHEADTIRLQPENDEYEPIYTRDCQSMAKVSVSIAVTRRSFA